MNQELKKQLEVELVKFPIGISVKGYVDRQMILANKAAIVLYLSQYEEKLASKTELIAKVLKEVLNIDSLPTIGEAETFFRLSNGFLQDYNKIALIKENNTSYSEMYDTLLEALKEGYDLDQIHGM